MADKLNPGDSFPDIALTTTVGDSIKLPADLDTPYTIALFYRGHW